MPKRTYDSKAASALGLSGDIMPKKTFNSKVKKWASLPVFSGKQLWKAINKIGKKKKRKKIAKATEKALYLLGCQCQELETKIENWYKEHVERHSH